MSDLCDDLPRVVCLNSAKVEHLRALTPTPEDVAPLADALRVLGHPVRLSVLLLLAREECCVCDLAHTLRQPVSTASQHLRKLQQVGLVQSRKDGKLVFYSLADSPLVEAVRVLAAAEASR